MSNLVIADQEFAAAAKHLSQSLLELRQICFDYASILRTLAYFEGFDTEKFRENIDPYCSSIQNIGVQCESLAERIFEETGTYINEVNIADDFIY